MISNLNIKTYLIKKKIDLLKMLLKFILIGISVTLNYGNSVYNNSTENLEFCLYTKNSVIKIINPFYVDLDSNEIVKEKEQMNPYPKLMTKALLKDVL